MHKHLYFFGLFTATLFLFFSGFAQSPGIEWQRTIGNPGSDPWRNIWNNTIVTSDSNFLVVADNANRAGDVQFTKIARDGMILWDKVLGGSWRESYHNVFNTPDGGILFVGTTGSHDGDVVGFHTGQSANNTDMWIVKLSGNGSIEWQKCIGGSQMDYAAQATMQADGSVIVVGDTYSNDGDFAGMQGPTDAFALKVDRNGNIVWRKLIGGSNVDYGRKILIKPNGNILVGGTSYSSLPTNKGLYDIFLAELDANGNQLWINDYGGSSDEWFVNILQTGSGKYTVVGASSSSDGDVTGAHGMLDVWFFSVNDNGTMLWQKAVGGSGSEYNPKANFVAADSSLVITAATQSSDGDMAGNHGGDDVWIGKLSNTGSLLWKRCLGGSGNETFNNIDQVLVNAAGQTTLLAETASNNGDVSGNHGIDDLWLVKITADGAIEWQKCYGGSLNESTGKLYADGTGFTILAGTRSNDGDVQGMHYKSDTNTIIYRDWWLINVNSNGAINWQRPLGGYDEETPGNLLKINGNYFVSGTTNSNNGDVSGLKGTNNVWVVKLGLSNVIKGTVFYDLNKNGVKDADESFYDNVVVKSEKKDYLRWSIPYNGQYKIEVDTGQLTTSVVPSNPYFTVVPASRQTIFNTYFSTDSIDFALQPMPGKRDISVSIIPVGPARPGFNSSYRIYYKNTGTDTIATGKVSLLKDSRTSFVSAVPSPDHINGDTLSWDYNNLQPFNAVSIEVVLKNTAPPVVNVGDTLLHQVLIDPRDNDLVPVNNTDTLKQLVTGSFDPNDKWESHAGAISLQGVTGGDYLTYVINFQNLGTDTAFNIVVRDTLDEKLDWSTMQMIGASHAWSLQVHDGNKCAWTFQDINLPYSGINEPLSHGYIAYRIKPKANLSIGDKITNSASIYFDYNLPVVTNAVITEVKHELIALPVIAGLLNNYCGSETAQKVKLLNLPDNSITTLVKLDNQVLPVVTDSSFSFIVSALQPGPHTIAVSYAKAGGSKTTTVNFTVTTAATPDVNVSANITQVINLTNPVTVTAANAADGGKAPLYTFAWNRTFTNIIQAEGSANTVNITPSSLAIGDNKVYVRMKTSETCYTTQTNTDSITIRRDQSTGIIDADYPGQVINVYPNPFNGPVILNGLSTAKTYMVRVLNVSGQVVYTKRVTNRSTIDINRLKDGSGVYWLSIYDEKKKRLLGSIKLLKQ